jgi:hypothetical protein
VQTVLDVEYSGCEWQPYWRYYHIPKTFIRPKTFRSTNNLVVVNIQLMVDRDLESYFATSPKIWRCSSLMWWSAFIHETRREYWAWPSWSCQSCRDRWFGASPWQQYERVGSTYLRSTEVNYLLSLRNFPVSQQQPNLPCRYSRCFTSFESLHQSISNGPLNLSRSFRKT